VAGCDFPYQLSQKQSQRTAFDISFCEDTRN